MSRYVPAGTAGVLAWPPRAARAVALLALVTALAGVESELVVRWEHSVQGHPTAIEEVRRTLLHHAGIR